MGYWKKLANILEARKQEERLLLLVALISIVAYAGFVLAIEPFQLQQADMARRLSVANLQIIEESTKQAEITATFSSDPNSFARKRHTELQQLNANADADLNNLYGQLIDPREMSQMLTRILQRETTLTLVSLNNTPSEVLLTTNIGLGTDAEGNEALVEVYKHGLQMEFEGSFLETVRYLHSLEALDNNFFWENMKYSVIEYPRARIILDIYTLSTQRGWIGV